MKNSAMPEVQELREEIRRLTTELALIEECVHLELVPEAGPWEVWPYTWASAGWNKVVECGEEATHRFKIWRLERMNLARLQDATIETDGGLAALKLV